MKLSFNKKYLSINYFNEVELPDFTILTGINGSGKSHLLEAIENNSVAVIDMPNIKIVRFDYRDFYLENEAIYNARHIIEERNNAWIFFNNKIRNQVEALANNLGQNYQELKRLCAEKDRAFLNLKKLT